jgi:hypothetical protein
MKLFDYTTVNPNIDADHVVAQEKARAVLASAGITIDEKTGAIGMSRGGTAIGMSRAHTATGMTRAPTVIEGTGELSLPLLNPFSVRFFQPPSSLAHRL